MIQDTFNNKPYILHLPGMGKERAGSFLYFEKENPVRIHSNITIITIATDDILEDCPLIQQLNNNKVPYINAAKYYIPDGEWQKINKLPLIIKAFEEVKTPYILVIDANDTVILQDLDEAFIEKWKQFNADILYNAGQYPYPKDLMIAKESIEWDNIRNMNVYTNHYLNAGVCFGKSDVIREFYKSAYDIYESHEYEHIDSEQYYIKLAYMYRDDVKIDNGNHLFLCSHGT